eukprot:344753_1
MIFVGYIDIVDSFVRTDTHTALKGDHSSDDQIFFILHWYIMLIRLLWTLSWNYDMIDMNQPYFDDNKLFFEAYIILISYGIIGIIENGIVVVDMYQKVDHSSLLGKYNRNYSRNSCWNEIIIGDIDELEIKTCNDHDRYIENINNSSFDGGKDNQYLIEIRRNTYDVVLYTFGADVNLRVCYGVSDHKCNEYHQHIHNELVNNINLLTIIVFTNCCNCCKDNNYKMYAIKTLNYLNMINKNTATNVFIYQLDDIYSVVLCISFSLIILFIICFSNKLFVFIIVWRILILILALIVFKVSFKPRHNGKIIQDLIANGSWNDTILINSIISKGNINSVI